MTTRAFARNAGIVVAAIGIVALLGWVLRIPWLASFLSGLATMKVNSALGFILIGAGLWFRSQPRPGGVERALGAVALAVGALSLSQHLFGWNLGIDEWLVRDLVTAPANHPGRPSPATSLLLILLGSALCLHSERGLAAEASAASATVISLLALLGYLYGVTGLYRSWLFSSFSLPTTFAGLAASAGLLVVGPVGGWGHLLSGNGRGLQIARRSLVAFAVGLPATGWVCLRAEQSGWFNEEFSAGVLVTVACACLAWALARSAQQFTDLQAQHDAVRDQVAQREARLKRLHTIDRSILDDTPPEDVAAVALESALESLHTPRAIVNVIDLEGQVRRLAVVGAATQGPQRVIRYPVWQLGDVEGLHRGEPHVLDAQNLPPGDHRDDLLASGARYFMVVPMTSAGKLIGALKFGGASTDFPAEVIATAEELAAQMSIALTQARLHESARRQAAELEERVAQRTAELTIANRELEAFTFSVSHDLRVPLRNLDAYAQLLEADHAHALDAVGRRLLDNVRDCVRRMGLLIESLLELARLGRQALHPETLDMAAMAREVVAELAPARHAQVSIGDLPPARGDAALLRQVWLNLLGNALKYSGRREAPRVEVEGETRDGERVYRVRDNGTGFDPESSDRLFGAFHREHSGAEFSGSGVGLAIVRNIVERHGGRVWAEGRPDAGATFHFTLPA